MTGASNNLITESISSETADIKLPTSVPRLPSSVQLGPYSIATNLPDLPSAVCSSAVQSSPVPRPLVFNTINTHSWVVAEQDPEFNQALMASDVLLPDGEGIVWAVKYLTGKKIKKIAGYDVFIHLLEYLQQTGGTCFFMGGSQQTLDLIKERLSKEYPNIKAGFFSPPYKPEFSEEDNTRIYYELRKTKDELNSRITNYEATSPPHHITTLFVGMTAPKQEKWVLQHKDQLPAGIVCSIGAVFDFYAGTVKRPPAWMIRMKLEWLGRLTSNPKRIWKRVFLSTPKFILSILKLPRQT